MIRRYWKVIWKLYSHANALKYVCGDILNHFQFGWSAIHSLSVHQKKYLWTELVIGFHSRRAFNNSIISNWALLFNYIIHYNIKKMWGTTRFSSIVKQPRKLRDGLLQNYKVGPRLVQQFYIFWSGLVNLLVFAGLLPKL